MTTGSVEPPTEKARPLGLLSTREDHLIAGLAALAIVIHIAESALPTPLPGVKPGLANVVTLVALCLYGWRLAVWVSLLRILVGSLVVGTFLAPPFFLSAAGAISSLIVLGIVVKWNSWCRDALQGVVRDFEVGPVGLGILAAMSHMMGQIWTAYVLFVPHVGIFHLLPILLTTALIFGLISGSIAQIMLGKINKEFGADHSK